MILVIFVKVPLILFIQYMTENNFPYVLENLTGFKNNKIVDTSIHGWKYAYSNQPTASIKSSWDKKFNLGICADWFSGPKAEDAWLSAYDLFKKI